MCVGLCVCVCVCVCVCDTCDTPHNTQHLCTAPKAPSFPLKGLCEHLGSPTSLLSTMLIFPGSCLNLPLRGPPPSSPSPPASPAAREGSVRSGGADGDTDTQKHTALLLSSQPASLRGCQPSPSAIDLTLAGWCKQHITCYSDPQKITHFSHHGVIAVQYTVQRQI